MRRIGGRGQMSLFVGCHYKMHEDALFKLNVSARYWTL